MDFKDAIENTPGVGRDIMLGEYWFEFSAPGNILYGYYGTAWGFTPLELHGGAGVAQFRDYIAENKELGSKIFGTVDDYYAIELGIHLYNKGYKPDGNITIDEFSSLIVDFEYLDKLWPRFTPMTNAINDDWPYYQGYFDND